MAKTSTPTYKEIEEAIMNSPALEDLVDDRDYQYEEIMGAVETPREFSLRDKCSPVKNQFKRGTCVGFDCTGIPEFFNRAELNDPDLDLSEEYLFRRIKEFDLADYKYDGYGAYLRSGAKALKKWGTCLEETAPYNKDGGEDAWKTFEPTEEMDEEAARYKIASYLRVANRVELIKQSIITSQAPLSAGFTFWASYRDARKDGIVPMPDTVNEKRIGGHAMEIVGWKYINDELYFELKNSWSTSWGDDGYLWWPAKYIAGVHSVWSFVDLLTNPNVINNKKIEENKKLVSGYAIGAWEKAIKAGIVSASSMPKDKITKEDYFVFKDRAGELDAIIERNNQDK